MGGYPEKTLEDRQKELERYKKETETREAALKSKRAGAEIERLERERKRNNIFSIRGRMLRLNEESIHISEKIVEELLENKDSKFWHIQVQEVLDTYHSIKEDIRICFKDKSGQVDKLFPEKNFKLTGSPRTFQIAALQSIVREFFDVLEYLKRYD